MLYKPHSYQDYTTQQIINNEVVLEDGSRACGPLLEMGLGKTVATLTALVELFRRQEIKRVLIVAPKRVIEDTWPKEIEKWQHTRCLRYSVVAGSESQRKAALRAEAQVYLVSRDNIVWLVGLLGNKWPFDMVVLDELSSFKSSKSQRWKALRHVRPLFKRVVGLTGTPRGNGLIDLWAQMYLLDRGERLGKTITSYRDRYFTPGQRKGHVVYNYELKKGDELLGLDINEAEIYDKIGDICFSMKAEDWLELPPLMEQDVLVTMPLDRRKEYLKFERDQVLQLVSTGEQITALNAASLTGKLLQYANGAVYRDDKSYFEVHDLKLQALAEDVEAAQGDPMVVFYQYRHDLERIMHALKTFKPHQLQGTADISRWNEGKIPLLLAHPASAGHGLNMQAGGRLMGWFGLTWSLELYLQAVARLHRQGQGRPVICRRYLVAGTMDEDVLQALQGKASGQEAMMQAVKARINSYL